MPFGVGFTRIFECQVVEDLKNRYHQSGSALFLCVHLDGLFFSGPIDLID